MTKKRKMKPSALVEDFSLYPRAKVDSMLAARYADAMATGEKFPPPIIEEGSGRIIDGFHRVRAWRKTYGDEPMPVILEAFESEEAALLAAVAANGSHGRAYGGQDQIRIARLLEEYDYTTAQTAAVLKITQPKLERLIVTRSAQVSGVEITTTAPRRIVKTGEKMPKPEAPSRPLTLKPALRHLAGFELSEEQAAVNSYLAGGDQLYLARQLRLLIEHGLIDYDATGVLHELAAIRDALSEIDLPEPEVIER